MIPQSLQGVLWSKSVDKLDLEKDKNYIIHQILMYGTLDHWKFLQTLYPLEEIKKVFLNHPDKIYTKPALHFVKNYLLNLEKEKIDDSVYLTSSPRIIRPGKAANL